jgi:hypothetical protein
LGTAQPLRVVLRDSWHRIVGAQSHPWCRGHLPGWSRHYPPTDFCSSARRALRCALELGRWPGCGALSNKTGADALLVAGNTRQHRARRKEVLADGKKSVNR